MLPIRERSPYFVESLYSGFRESHQYPLHDGPYYASFPPPSQFPEPLSRIPRSSSSIPTFGHYDESPFLDLPRGPPLRSSSAIPAYAYPGMTYRDVHPHGPPPNRPFRSTSSIPAYELHSHGRSSNRPTRSSSSIPAYNLEQPRSKKVAPVRMRLFAAARYVHASVFNFFLLSTRSSDLILANFCYCCIG